MTDTQKAYIEKLRTSGFGYKAIASKIGLSVNTVKTYCRTHGLTSQIADVPEDSELCPVCVYSVNCFSNYYQVEFQDISS